MNNQYPEAIGRCLDEIYMSDKHFPDIPLRHGDNIRAALDDLVKEVSGEAMRRMEEAEQALRDNTSILHEEARIYYDRAMAAEKRLELYATAARVIALHLERFCDESLPYDEMIADAARKAGEKLQKAKEWNELCELELNNIRSLKDDLEGHLRAVMEHIAPMLKLYEPNLPEHPVISAIRDYLDKP